MYKSHGNMEKRNEKYMKWNKNQRQLLTICRSVRVWVRYMCQREHAHMSERFKPKLWWKENKNRINEKKNWISSMFSRTVPKEPFSCVCSRAKWFVLNVGSFKRSTLVHYFYTHTFKHNHRCYCYNISWHAPFFETKKNCM